MKFEPNTSLVVNDDAMPSSGVLNTGFDSNDAQQTQNQETSKSCSVAEQKPMKAGKQRFRWNLLFNVLVWVVVPLPLWVPYIDNTVAVYLIPCLQAVFVLMWVIIVGLATRTMVTLYR